MLRSASVSIWAPLAVLAVGISAFPLSAQVQGRVVERGSGAPINAARVLIFSEAGDTLAELESRGDGRFALFESLPNGRHRIEGSAPGFSTVSQAFAYADGPLAFELQLQPSPIALDGLEVSVDADRRSSRRLLLNGFYDRKQRGFGDHLEFEDPDSRLGATRASHLLRRMAGVSVSRGGEPFFRGDRECTPVLVLDGVVIRGIPSRVRSFDDAMPPPEDILAIEVYRSAATVPPNWLRRGMCGAVAVWTR